MPYFHPWNGPRWGSGESCSAWENHVTAQEPWTTTGSCLFTDSLGWREKRKARSGKVLRQSREMWFSQRAQLRGLSRGAWQGSQPSCTLKRSWLEMPGLGMQKCIWAWLTNGALTATPSRKLECTGCVPAAVGTPISSLCWLPVTRNPVIVYGWA